MEKRKNNLIFLLIALVLVVLAFNLYLFFTIPEILEEKEIDSSIIVSDSIGIDLNTTALTFGQALRGGSSTRTINIKNDYNFPVSVFIKGLGDMEKLIMPLKEELDANETKEIKVQAFVPLDYEFKEYKGKMRTVIRKSI